ncbi:MAG: glycoside hydrolase family 3 N-terminal domain-containing protein [Bacteroidales bacterium]|nr:glycoside hydrolase family 3 N-terminal domain-containing protein [Bacteroidales bacterium]
MYKMISKRNIAGVILMKHNILNREQLIELTNSLQLRSANTNLAIPLFIATDQEGGEIVRIRVAGVSEFSSQAVIENKEQAFAVAENRAKELIELGINTNFSPVLDYIIDDESFLYYRTFQSDINKTSELGSAMVKGYQKYIISSPKHFLGHPDTISDPHSSRVISNFSLEDIKKRVSIFKKVNEDSSPAMVMTSHITYKNMDPDYPCSLSKICINNYLKKEAKLSANSLIVTDAMEMGAIADNYSNSEAAVLAIKAGNDILLYTRYPEKQAEAYEAIIEAVNKKKINISQINDSVLKILRLKIKYLY